MSPGALFAASVGMCVGGYVAAYCRHGDIPYEHMTISLMREPSRNEPGNSADDHGHSSSAPRPLDRPPRLSHHTLALL